MYTIFVEIQRELSKGQFSSTWQHQDNQICESTVDCKNPTRCFTCEALRVEDIESTFDYQINSF